jgi:inosine/xanthosine triphosphate pyrophosphatase family protein
MDVGVNVRWLTQQLLTDATLTGKKAKWTTLLGVNTGTQIRVYEGVIHGTITAPRGEGFGFDPIFVPEMSNRTLAELEALGVKDAFSARCFAADAFKDDYPVMVVCLDDITDWTGEYQH